MQKVGPLLDKLSKISLQSGFRPIIKVLLKTFKLKAPFQIKKDFKFKEKYLNEMYLWV